MAPFYDDEAMSPLVPREDEDDQRKTHKSSILVNRILVVVTLVLMVLVSIYFQSKEVILATQLQNDEDKIHLLEKTIDAQGRIIQRFNESVTNSDVLKKLDLLEKSTEESQAALKQTLYETIQDVNSKLDQTLINLDDTVKKAEQEITDQVETVKQDFQQYVVRTEDQFSMENSFMVYQLAGTFTLLSCLISMWHMTAHLRKFNQPIIQRKILAILWMSPIYAITSWFSLVFNSAEGYLAIIKDGYESYIIYQFLSFCIAVLGKGNRDSVVDLLTKRADHLTPPFRLFFCCRPDPYENDRQLADAILLQCQFFAMQFVFFRPVTTIAKVVLQKYEYYGPWADGPNDYRAPQFYIVLIQNLSIFTAFTGLLKFYHAVDKDLEWCRPFAKFLCIKGVVFMTFWQGLAITILAETTDVGGADAEEWAMSAQNFLICLEMLLFSIAHFYCFPTEEWEDDYQVNYKKSKFGDSIALNDFMSDLKLIMKGNKKKKKKTPTTIPEGDEETDDDTTTAHDESVVDDEEGNENIKEVQKAYARLSEGEDKLDEGELEETRQRIIESGFLEDLAFMSEGSAEQEASGNAGSEATNEKEGERSLSGVQEDEEEGVTTYKPLYGSIGSDSDHATERTGLLSSQPESAPSPLRPSIFTTIADISQREQEEENSAKDQA